MKLLACLLTLLIATGKAELRRRVQSTDTQDIDWRIPSEPNDPITVEAGTALNFIWSGRHNLLLHPSGSCDEEGAELLGATSNGGEVSYTLSEDEVGSTLFFSCDFRNHCNFNMYQEVIVVPSSNSIPVDWKIPSEPNDPITVEAGTTLNFIWSGSHNLLLHPSGSCDVEGAELLGATSNGGEVSYTLSEDEVGSTLFFSCDFGNHCNFNMYQEVIVVSSNPIPVNWRIPATPYAPITADVGTSIKFTWSGFHNLLLHPTGTCDGEGAIELGPTANGGEVYYTITEADAGSTLFFACDLGNHCNLDMYIEVIVPPAPTPAPAPPTGGLCFSGGTLVETRDRGSLRMDQLKIGDFVLVDEGEKYEQIYGFGHFDQKSVVTTDFLHIRTSTSSGLEMTPNHFVFVEGNKAVPASNLSVGDKIMLASGETDIVISINKVSRNGIFAPFTLSGTIITNGIKSSSFATIQGSRNISLGGIDIPITYHQLGVIFESPHRLVCRYFDCAAYEAYNDEGMSQWVEIPMKAFQWMLQQHFLVSSAIFLSSFVVLCLINLLEIAVLNPSFCTFLFTTAVVAVHYYYRRAKKMV